MANRFDVMKQRFDAWRKTPSGQLRWGVIVVLMLVLLLDTLWTSKVGLPMSGTVVEQGSGKPVANAKVIVTWYGMTTPKLDYHESFRPKCYHAEVVDTDRHGHFWVPPWWTIAPLGPVFRLSSYNMEVGVYHRGYLGWRQRGDELPAQIAVQPFSGNADDRLADLDHLSYVAVCDASQEEEFIEALIKEIEQLRVSDPQRKAFTLKLLRDPSS